VNLLVFRSRSSPPYLRGSIRVLLATLLVVLGGCIELRPERSFEPQDDSPTVTPDLTPGAETIPGTIEASLVLLRQVQDPDQAQGSAIVLTEDGFLLTEESVARAEIEVVLPDGSTHRPALVTTERESGLALIKVPAHDLEPIVFSSQRPGIDSEVFVTGFDGTPPSIGRISGNLADVAEPPDSLDFRVRGAGSYTTDITLLPGFRGGALTDGDGTFAGLVVPGEDEGGNPVVDAVSTWFIQGWLSHREGRVEERIEAAESWETIQLPGDWEIAAPEDWGLNVSVDSDDAYRAELTPANPDVPMQLAYSVEPSDYGTDIEEFVSSVFEDRSSARIWTISSIEGHPYVRATISQEGALVDVAYVLDDTQLIAVSLTSGFQLESDHRQIDEARTLFTAVIESLNAPTSGS
jgi:hypothetical protein